MPKTDTNVDRYIDNAQPFAKPILVWLRAVVHKACPQVTETIKWGMPSFEYKGPFCGMASFKKHCVFGFWKHSLIKDPKGILERNNAMGSLGKITSESELPSEKALTAFIRQAMKLNDDNIKVVKPAKTRQQEEVSVPDYFLKELKKDNVAFRVFQQGSNSFRKEYVQWITEAKTEATREKRMFTAIDWLSEGKGRNWKYERK